MSQVNLTLKTAARATKVDPGLDLRTLPRMPQQAAFSPEPPIVHRNRHFATDPELHPAQLFEPIINGSLSPAPRWVYRDPVGFAVLIFTDGSAPYNGMPSVRAGCGVVFRPDGVGSLSFPLERVPGYDLTSNRAELRAAHAALQFRHWGAEGFKKIVIGTDSEYMVRGMCEYCFKWKQNGWKTSNDEPVKNRDLWEMLIDEVERWEGEGIHVAFYLLKRAWNIDADACAKAGADQPNIPDQFQRWVGAGL
ncbi:hypothetical protein BOTBODRAFT_136771 [Botryobasidium botryosum FD-172 SS1]|uniref:ribonuclease H n=1 Tax=Botryobasidium botryosum (strain FD-172 SS1) TaxID=930990 RepID=A0A067M4L1_BOTB1|nr:hypothetical protein BOTBODRAFT_136771 [Botryobasidium botryosum FD-172 SS1]